ncbi:MAG: hypothetical protein IT288_13985 [Bdellovibrionales bacterium]|nr:hypothetical protein [Bdellovibrionales bacterium]
MLAKLLSVVLCLWGTSSWALTNVTESLELPASVTATADRRCKDLTQELDKKWAQLLAKAPYVRSAEAKTPNGWRETAKADTTKTSERESFFVINVTRSHDFPLTVFNVAESKTECTKAQNADGTPCASSFTYTVEGNKAIVYEKVVGMAINQNYLDSFVYTLTLTDTEKTKCSLSSVLNIKNRNYLWQKRQLIGSRDLNTLEKGVITRFAQWSKSTFSQLEDQP